MKSRLSSPRKINEKYIEKMIYRVFRASYEEDKGGYLAPPDLIYVTDVSQCLLKSWFNRAFGEPPSDEKVVILVLGDDVHYLLNEKFPVGKGEESAERSINGVRIRGRADRVFSESIIEFKTATFIPSKPRDHHVLQLQLYLWLFDKKYGFIAYVSKRDGKVKAFKVSRDEDIIKKLLDRAIILSKHLKEGTMPEPEKGWLCDYCEYKSWCPVHRDEDQ